METILLIAALVTILWVATGLIGLERVRQLFRLAEKPPYSVSLRGQQYPEQEPVIGEIFRDARDAGRDPGWFGDQIERSKINEGFEPLRTKDRRKIVYRSKTLAHSDELVLMARSKKVKK